MLLSPTKWGGGITSQEENEIGDIFHHRSAKKGKVLLYRGKICDRIYFILKGAMRTYTETEEGREYTRMIATENKFICNLSSFITNSISDETIETIEDCEFLTATKSDIFRLIEKIPKLKNLYIEILEHFNEVSTHKLNKIICLKDEEKLKYHFKMNKEFVARFPDRINASYLHMSRENYSRYKKLVNNLKL